MSFSQEDSDQLSTLAAETPTPPATPQQPIQASHPDNNALAAGLPSSSPTPAMQLGPPITIHQPHTNWAALTMHAAKCDRCNERNESTMYRCIDCSLQICASCKEDHLSLWDGQHVFPEVERELALWKKGTISECRVFTGVVVEEASHLARSGAGESGLGKGPWSADPPEKKVPKRKRKREPAVAAVPEPGLAPDTLLTPTPNALMTPKRIVLPPFGQSRPRSYVARFAATHKTLRRSIDILAELTADLIGIVAPIEREYWLHWLSHLEGPRLLFQEIPDFQLTRRTTTPTTTTTTSMPWCNPDWVGLILLNAAAEVVSPDLFPHHAQVATMRRCLFVRQAHESLEIARKDRQYTTFQNMLLFHYKNLYLAAAGGMDYWTDGHYRFLLQAGDLMLERFAQGGLPGESVASNREWPGLTGLRGLEQEEGQERQEQLVQQWRPLDRTNLAVEGFDRSSDVAGQEAFASQEKDMLLLNVLRWRRESGRYDMWVYHDLKVQLG